MTSNTIKPRVFISSVIDGFSDVRESARQAIEISGGEAVMAEQFGARDASPRNACLNEVASCDALVVIIGARGGYTAPSGKLIVEEEYDESQRKAMPTLFYLQDIKRDPAANALARRLSDLIDGRFRATFNIADELKARLQSDLPGVFRGLSMRSTDHHKLTSLLKAERDEAHEREPSLRTVIAPERDDSIGSLIEVANVKRLYRLAHDCDLFQFELAKRCREGADSLSLEQFESADMRSPLDRVTISENGIITVDSLLKNRDVDDADYVLSVFNMHIPTQVVEERCAAAILFAELMFEEFDPHCRHTRFLINAALSNYSAVQISRERPRGNSISIPMHREHETLLAFQSFKLHSRIEMRQADGLAKSAVERLLRQIRANRM